MAGSGIQHSRSMKPRFRNANLLLSHVGLECETPGCVAHIKCTELISGPVCGDRNGQNEDHRHHLNSWSSDSSNVAQYHTNTIVALDNRSAA